MTMTSPSVSPALMRVENVVKKFGGLVAVAGVSLDIPERSIVSVIGPNGAGKTTLFNMLTGLYKPTSRRTAGCSGMCARRQGR
jgi:branched-chain amino acid transport system ATP-binding protein